MTTPIVAKWAPGAAHAITGLMAWQGESGKEHGSSARASTTWDVSPFWPAWAAEVGKTTASNMAVVAAAGVRAAAGRWSPSSEERRKSLMSYFSEGVAAIAWDNIERGSEISCPHVEASLTTPEMSDRVLGSSVTRTAPATSVQFFTGNNITAAGDMTSRTLIVRLDTDRTDPENRMFRHQDPIGWTLEHAHQALEL